MHNYGKCPLKKLQRLSPCCSSHTCTQTCRPAQWPVLHKGMQEGCYWPVWWRVLNAAELIEIEKGIGENKFSQMCKYVSVLMGNWDVHNASFGKREQPKHKAVKQYYLFLQL